MSKNLFLYSYSNKRYHTLDYSLRSTFGQKVFKVALSGGFTCPNRDGTKGTGGCLFCSGSGSGEFAGDIEKTVALQISEGREILRKKWPQAGTIAYFQSFSNTYGPINHIKSLCEEALMQPGVLGLSLATRADCLPLPVLNYLSELNARTFLEVELGLQSVHDTTAVFLNRGHTFTEFITGFEALKERNIKTCIHLINGLPGEDYNMMLETAKQVANLSPHSVKLHMLHVIRGTALGDAYEKEPFPLLNREEYTQIICDQLELLPSETVIQRITGDGERATLIAPLWTSNKRMVLNGIDQELVRRDSWQGKFYRK